MKYFSRVWYQSSPPFFLLPFSWLFRGIVFLRRNIYRLGIKRSYRFPVPIIIVGNISIGGTGKTPLVVWLVNFLRKNGFHPGIISRGYGGEKQRIPQWVEKNSDPKKVGDEAVLLAKRCDCPVVV